MTKTERNIQVYITCFELLKELCILLENNEIQKKESRGDVIYTFLRSHKRKKCIDRIIMPIINNLRDNVKVPEIMTVTLNRYLYFITAYNPRDIVDCTGTSIKEIYPSKETIGMLIKKLDNGREIKVKSGKLLRELLIITNREVDNKAIENFANEYYIWHESRIGDGKVFISDYGDVQRLLYAYRKWDMSDSSCMAFGEPKLSPDLIDSEVMNENCEPYYCSNMLYDYFVNKSEWRIAIIHKKDGTLLSRCVIRKVYSLQADGSEKYEGEYIDRMYCARDSYFFHHKEITEKVLINMGVKIVGTRERTLSATTRIVKWNNEYDTSEQVGKLFIKWVPFAMDNYAAFQDTFVYWDYVKNRCFFYYCEDQNRRKILYQETYESIISNA